MDENWSGNFSMKELKNQVKNVVKKISEKIGEEMNKKGLSEKKFQKNG